MVIEVQLYGALKKLATSECKTITLTMPALNGETSAVPPTIADLREEIKAQLLGEKWSPAEQKNYAQLIERSALSDGVRVLKNSESLRENTSLALLPPVCGG